VNEMNGSVVPVLFLLECCDDGEDQEVSIVRKKGGTFLSDPDETTQMQPFDWWQHKSGVGAGISYGFVIENVTLLVQYSSASFLEHPVVVDIL
jgi:hypothetical protein